MFYFLFITHFTVIGYSNVKNDFNIVWVIHMLNS